MMITPLFNVIRGPTPLLAASMVAAVGLASAGATTAAAQSVLPHDQLETLLGERYGERPVARGLAQNGQMVEVFATVDGDTWTIVMTTPRGLSRIGSAGVAWSNVGTAGGGLSQVAEADE